MALNIFRIDGRTFTDKATLYHHIEQQHGDQLDHMGWPASRYYFMIKYKKSAGKSVISGKPTDWNPVTERYERFADEAERQQYREDFKAKMMKKYGKTHLTDDPEQQKIMLGNRGIAEAYAWADGSKTNVTGAYESHFLHFLETVYSFRSSYLTEPPTIYYKDSDGKVRFYLPDFYIPSMNLIVEVKGSNPHYQQRDAQKEVWKKDATLAEGFNYVQVEDKFYTPFNVFFRAHVSNDNE